MFSLFSYMILRTTCGSTCNLELDSKLASRIPSSMSPYVQAEKKDVSRPASEFGTQILCSNVGTAVIFYIDLRTSPKTYHHNAKKLKTVISPCPEHATSKTMFSGAQMQNYRWKSLWITPPRFQTFFTNTNPTSSKKKEKVD